MIIVIASAKGGSGKTTTAMHLAEYLSRKRMIGRVVLLDADPDNQSAIGWYERGEGWKFDLASPEDELGEYDALVVDSGAAPDGDDLEKLMDAADLLIVPTAPAPMDLESAGGVVAEFEQDGSVKLLVTLAPPGRSRAGEHAVNAMQDAGLIVCPHVIKRRAVVLEVSGVGATVASTKGKPAKMAWVEHQKAFQWLLEGVI